MFVNPTVAVNVAVWNGAASIRHAKAGDEQAAIRCSNVILTLADTQDEDEDAYFLAVVRRLGRVRALALGFEPAFVHDAI